MGNISTIEYAVPVTEKIPGETPIYRNPLYKDGVLDGPVGIKNMKSAILHATKTYPNNNCLGTIVRQQGQPDFIKYFSYQEMLEHATRIGSAIVHEQLAFQPQGEDLRLVGIFCRNRAEWSIVDVACILYRMTTVPIYDTLGDENIAYVLEQTMITTLFVNDISLKILMKTKHLHHLKILVCFDAFTEEQENFFKEKQIKLRLYSELMEIGSSNKIDYNAEQFKVNPKDCLSFCYTSGTTGPPKAAMLSHNNYCSFLSSMESSQDVTVDDKDVVLSYLPLPHVLEREEVFAILYKGGTVVYSSGDVQKIKDDLAVTKPTIFVSVPRLYSRFFEQMNKKIGELQGWTKTAFNHGLSKKLNNVTTNGGMTHKVYDRLFFNRTKAALGGRVRLMISGSAPLVPEVHKFLKVTMTAPLIEGYGQTESTGATFITYTNDPILGHVGGPVSSTEYKLVDIPEMRYTSEDKDENGNPAPRGEIWMRGSSIFLGYYKQEEKTKEALTEDGWLKTGDVGVILYENKALKIIDRKKNIFKLSQGEYVAAEKVEKVYLDCPLISEIFVHGESTEHYAIAIVVAHAKLLKQKAKQLGIEDESYENLCLNQKVKTMLLGELNKMGKAKGLKSFEMVKNIYIEPHSFQGKDILTNTMKVQRHEAKKVYKNEIQALYKQGMLGVDKEK